MGVVFGGLLVKLDPLAMFFGVLCMQENRS